MALHCLVLLLLFLLLIRTPPTSATSSSLVGINYGLVADNLPPPEKVTPLLASIGVGRVKIYNAEPTVLRALADTGIEVIVALPNECLSKVANNPPAALSWARANIQPYIPRTKISALTVGNEALTSNDTSFAANLLPAMQSLSAALAALGLDKTVTVTTAHSVAVLSTSYPPSAGAFRRELLPYLCPVLAFHARTNSPFLINAYPYFAYQADPKRVQLDYVLFEPNDGVADPKSGLKYDNMLHAQVDAVYAAVAAAGGAAAERGVEVRVSETGWPSAGDEDETGATPENAAKYNGNLMRMVAEGKGTPARPKTPLRVYVFALFNENLKPGPASERNYGLFKPDGTPAYHLDITVPQENTSTGGDGDGDGGGGGGGGGEESGQPGGPGGDGYYSYSAASVVGPWLCPEGAEATMLTSTLLGLVFHFV